MKDARKRQGATGELPSARAATPPSSHAPHTRYCAACGRTRSRHRGASSGSRRRCRSQVRAACSSGCSPAGSAARTCRRSWGGATRSSTSTASPATRCTRSWARSSRRAAAGTRIVGWAEHHLGLAELFVARAGRDHVLDDELSPRRGDRRPAAVHGAAPARPDPGRRGQAGRGDRAGLDRAALQPRAEGPRRGVGDRRRSRGPRRRRRGVRGRRGRVRGRRRVGAGDRASGGRTSSSRPSATTPARWRRRSPRSPRTAPCSRSASPTRPTTRSRSWPSSASTRR